jgi:hypothetical protein
LPFFFASSTLDFSRALCLLTYHRGGAPLSRKGGHALILVNIHYLFRTERVGGRELFLFSKGKSHWKTLMKKIIFAFTLLINTCVMFAQENEFEGVLHYKSEIRSKVPEVSNKSLMTMMLFTDTQMTLVKKGNYKIIDPKSTIWYKPDEERVYYKFKGIDTLYFQEYGDDSTEVKKISKSDQLTNIGNFKCKSVTLQTDKGSLKFYYSPDYKLNPSYDKNNKIGRFDVFTKETGSIRLGDETDKELYSTSQVCTKLEQRNLDPHEFDLPKYPVKKLVRGFLVQPPRPKGDEQGWTKYLKLYKPFSLLEKKGRF